MNNIRFLREKARMPQAALAAELREIVRGALELQLRCPAEEG